MASVGEQWVLGKYLFYSSIGEYEKIHQVVIVLTFDADAVAEIETRNTKASSTNKNCNK